MKKKIFKRKVYDKMLEWKLERNGSTALLLKGARRVGKSTVAKAFAEKEYVKEKYTTKCSNGSEREMVAQPSCSKEHAV